MSLYPRHLLPRLIHCVCASPVIEHQRRLVVPQARGQVLEIGFGSGLNLPHHRRDQVERLWALEPSAEMRALAAPRIAASGLDVHWLDLPVEALPLPDAGVRRWQDRLDGPWGRFAGGGHLNREMEPPIASAGFCFDEPQSRYLPKTPRFAGYNTWGCARAG